MRKNISFLVPCLVILFLAGFTSACGGGSSTPTRTPPPSTGQFTNVYVVFPPASGVNNQHFMSTVINQNAINGVTVAVAWNQVETISPGTIPCTPLASDTCQKDSSSFYHTYDWSTVDSGNTQWFGTGKKVNMILNGIGGASPNCALTNSCINPLTPYYVTSSSWANLLGVGIPQDVINAVNDGCTNNVGLDTTSMTRNSSGLVTVTENNHGYNNGDTIWVTGSAPTNYNISEGALVQGVTTNTFQYQSDTHTADNAVTPGTVISRQQSYPVPYEFTYKTAWEAFIAAAIYHFNHSSNLAQIDYMRVGRSVGGEAYPYCIPNMEALPSPNTFTESVWISYYTEIDQVVANQGPMMQILDPLNQAGTGQPNDPIVTGYADMEGQAAVTFKNASSKTNGIGSQGLQASDITNYAAGAACSSDWCNLFNENYQSGIPLELQQLSLSAPVAESDVMNATGSLVPLLPFAVSRHMTILELYNLDALLAYDPNYCVLNVPDNGLCGAGSVEIPTIELPADDQEPYFKAAGQPGGAYATVINQTEGQH